MQKPHLVSFLIGVAVLAGSSAPTVALAQPFVAAHGAAAPKSVSARTLLHHLTVRTESHASTYARSKFKAWIDADHDGEDTRAEVLKAESSKRATVNSNGTVKAGKWVSRYDGVTVTIASKLDIDHLVPLEEAWVSGAAGWTALKREAFANDLGYGADLIAVTAHANRSKGDREPNTYLPAKASYRCTYVKNYIAVKSRWHLSVNASEKRALSRDLSTYCLRVNVVKPATPKIAVLTGVKTPGLPVRSSTPVPNPTPSSPNPISTPIPTSAPTPISAPMPTSTPTATANMTAPATTAPTATPTPTASATTVPTSYYANCDAVRAAGRAPLYRWQPGYRSGLDRDGDGVACEAS